LGEILNERMLVSNSMNVFCVVRVKQFSIESQSAKEPVHRILSIRTFPLREFLLGTFHVEQSVFYSGEQIINLLNLWILDEE
jgi:hypothetical protein